MRVECSIADDRIHRSVAYGREQVGRIRTMYSTDIHNIGVSAFACGRPGWGGCFDSSTPHEAPSRRNPALAPRGVRRRSATGEFPRTLYCAARPPSML